MVERDFLCRVLVCDNAEGIHVGASASEGRNGYDRQKALHLCLACKKVPCISIIKGRGAHEFCAVYDRSPANCQDDADVLFFADGSHAIDSGVPGIGFHASRLEEDNRCIRSNLFDIRVEGSLLDARASIDHETAASMFFELAFQIGQLIVAKVDFGGHMKGEICVVHGSLWAMREVEGRKVTRVAYVAVEKLSIPSLRGNGKIFLFCGICHAFDLRVAYPDSGADHGSCRGKPYP